MQYLLVQQGVQKALLGKSKKPRDMSNDEWEELYARALSTIWLCLANDVLFNIIEEKSTTSLWRKLKGLYMMNYLTN